jgi:hypothetical protein
VRRRTRSPTKAVINPSRGAPSAEICCAPSDATFGYRAAPSGRWQVDRRNFMNSLAWSARIQEGKCLLVLADRGGPSLRRGAPAPSGTRGRPRSAAGPG